MQQKQSFVIVHPDVNETSRIYSMSVLVVRKFVRMKITENVTDS